MSNALLWVAEMVGVVLALTGLWTHDYAFAACGYGMACWLHLTRKEARK